MAEERLIDDDLNKDKKYRIRKNADGEEELYIDESAEETFEEPAFVLHGGESEVEEPAGETQQPPAAETESAYALSVEQAKECIDRGDYSAALKSIAEAQNVDPFEGVAWALKLVALTSDFSDFSDVDSLTDSAEYIAKYCTDDQKSGLAAKSAPLESKIIELEERAASLHVEVEKKKDERREVFINDRKRAVLWFSVTALPCLVCLVVALAFTSVMFARQDGVNLIIMIVFAALALLFFVASLFTGHNLWAAMKKLSLNEQNSSTKLGREYEATLSEAEKLNTVLHSFKI